MVYEAIDICIMWGVMVYLAIGIAVCCSVFKRACKDKRFNRRNASFDKYANEHSMQVFLIIFLWPLLLVTVLFNFIYECFIDSLRR